MEKFDRSCVTNLGRSAIAKLNAGGSSLVLTRIQMGKGTVDASTDIQTFTELVDGVQYNDINSANTLVPYQTTIAFTIKGSDVEKTFQWSELGVFAKLDDGEEFLFAYAYSSNPDTLVEGSKVVDQYVFGIRFENSKKVSVELTVNQTVPLHAATHLDNGVDPIPTVSSERTGLVPVGPDDPRQVLVGHKTPRWDSVPLADKDSQGAIPALPGVATKYLAGDGRWHRMTPFIMMDTTLYVDPSNRDDPPKFSTLAKALEYSNDYHIFAGATITVELADGIHWVENTIEFEHPQAQQVRIVGASPRQAISFSDIVVSGDEIILTASSTKSLSVGMSVIIDAAGAYKGGRTIKSIQGSTITLTRSTIYFYPHEQHGMENSYMYFYKTRIACQKGALFLPNGLGRLARMGIHGSLENVGVYSLGKTAFSELTVNGFNRGIATQNGDVYYNFVAAHDCEHGLLADTGASAIVSGKLYCNGNTSVGFCVNGANAQINTDHVANLDNESSHINGNGIGIYSSSGSRIIVNSLFCQLNNIGVLAGERGFVQLGFDSRQHPNHISVNKIADVLAANGGYVRGFLHGGSGSNFSPQNNTSGNNFSAINIDP